MIAKNLNDIRQQKLLLFITESSQMKNLLTNLSLNINIFSRLLHAGNKNIMLLISKNFKVFEPQQ